MEILYQSYFQLLEPLSIREYCVFVVMFLATTLSCCRKRVDSVAVSLLPIFKLLSESAVDT